VNLTNQIVLVVDDDPDICWALEHVLGGLEAHCIRALNGKAALKAARLNRLTLALLDAKLPDVDGLELARSIRVAYPGILVVVVSGYFYKDDPAIQTALEQGLIHGFIEKPFSHREVIATVKKALSFQEAASLATMLQERRVKRPWPGWTSGLVMKYPLQPLPDGRGSSRAWRAATVRERLPAIGMGLSRQNAPRAAHGFKR
jgi:DNA-binding NtrC family response regulator